MKISNNIWSIRVTCHVQVGGKDSNIEFTYQTVNKVMLLVQKFGPKVRSKTFQYKKIRQHSSKQKHLKMLYALFLFPCSGGSSARKQRNRLKWMRNKHTENTGWTQETWLIHNSKLAESSFCFIPSCMRMLCLRCSCSLLFAKNYSTEEKNEVECERRAVV